ncbi:MAG: hypothetical protein AAGB16_10095 [Pseudomonadota bacterium]
MRLLWNLFRWIIILAIAVIMAFGAYWSADASNLSDLHAFIPWALALAAGVIGFGGALFIPKANADPKIDNQDIYTEVRNGNQKQTKIATDQHVRDIGARQERRTYDARNEERFQRFKVEILAELKQERPDAALFSEGLLDALAERTDETLSPDQQLANLIQQFDQARANIEAGERPTNLSDFVDQVAKQVAEKTRTGDLSGAQRVAADAVRNWRDQYEVSQANGEKVLETLISAALANADPDAVAEAEWQKIQLTTSETDQMRALWKIQNEYRRKGERMGIQLDVRTSLALCEIGLSYAPNAKDLAGHLNNKAIALEILGQRLGGEAGLQSLRDAVVTYDAALEVRTKESEAADWAATQQNKGIVLRILGERLAGEAGLQSLYDAVAAYDAALEVRTKESAAEAWAITQQNKAGALEILGQRLGGEAGLQSLSDAVAAYDAALEVRLEILIQTAIMTEG